VALLAYIRAQRTSHAGADRDAHAHPQPDPCRHLPRLRTPLPALTGSLQRRAELRRIPADHLTTPADIDVPGHSYSFGVVKAARAAAILSSGGPWSARAARSPKRCWWRLTELTRAMDASAPVGARS